MLHRFTVTWVDAGPGSAQPVHSHPHAQAYIVAVGAGRMLVDGDEAEVKPGDIVFMPPGTEHSLANTGENVLSYVTVAHPPFEIYRDQESGALRVRG
jgi:mannose-6-phosphate isomerase-like protein (cupin superfamily)